jgi:hypothetical protein
LFSNLPVQAVGSGTNSRLLTKTVDVLLLGPRVAIEGLRDSEVRVEANLAELTPPANAVFPHVRLPEAVAKQIEVKSVSPAEIMVKR